MRLLAIDDQERNLFIWLALPSRQTISASKIMVSNRQSAR